MSDGFDTRVEQSEEEHLAKEMGADRKDFSDKLIELLLRN